MATLFHTLKKNTNSLDPGNISLQIFIAWLLLLALIFTVYSPGLSGGFIFDDYPNIVEEEQIIPREFSWDEIRRISQIGNAGPLKRPLAVLSFATQLAVTGLDPWFFKLGNIFIHLLSTLAFGLMASRFVHAWDQRASDNDHLDAGQQPMHAAWMGLLAAAIWGLHPLNLTSVLYVVQRMTSMAALFGYLAVAFFIEVRRHTAFANTAPTPWFTISRIVLVIVCMVASVYSKENGFVFIGLMGLIEFFVFKFKNKNKTIHIRSQTLYRFATYTLIAVGLVVFIWSLTKILDTHRIAYREFSTPERLMTQARVLVFYLREFFLPDISKMSIYHDDIEISRSITTPISTLFATLFLVLISTLLIFTGKKYPILIFAWIWFLISHSLESTIFPLELVHEHRNYFATAGFCMTIVLALRSAFNFRKKTSTLLACLGLGVLASATAARSYEWREPLVLSKMEALRHPLSMRANHQLGRDLLIAHSKSSRDDALLIAAEIAFENAKNAQSISVSPYFGLLVVEFEKKEPDLEKIKNITQDLINHLKTGIPEASHPAHIAAFMHCQIHGKCQLGDIEALAVMTAITENPSASNIIKSEALKTAAQYAVSKANDWNFAKILIEEALNLKSETPTRIMYSQVLRNLQQFERAKAQIELARQEDSLKIFTEELEREKLAISKFSNTTIKQPSDSK